MRPTVVAVATLGFIALGFASSPPVFAQPQGHLPVRICHATASWTNPFTNPTVDASSIANNQGATVTNGHGEHTGPLFPPEDVNSHWGDIIPPFDFTDRGGPKFAGLNWPAGQAIWEAGCTVALQPPGPGEPSPEPTEPESPEPPAPTESPPASPIPTTPGVPSSENPGVPPGTPLPPGVTPTTLPPGVTAPPGPPPPGDLGPPLADPPNGAETMPPLEAVVVTPDGRKVDLGMLTPAERARVEAELDAARLPVGAPPAGYGGASTSNDANEGWLAAGVALLAASGLASFAYWRRRRVP